MRRQSDTGRRAGGSRQAGKRGATLLLYWSVERGESRRAARGLHAGMHAPAIHASMHACMPSSGTAYSVSLEGEVGGIYVHFLGSV